MHLTNIYSIAFAFFIALNAQGLPAQQDSSAASPLAQQLDWQALPEIPNSLGLAGPFVGIDRGTLLVAGGANFPKPVWENDKQWHDAIYALEGLANPANQDQQLAWKQVGQLPRALAYGASVSTSQGLLCIGGNDANQLYAECFLLKFDPVTSLIETSQLASLPKPQAYGQACVLGDMVYLVGGQTTPELRSARRELLSLNLAEKNAQWKTHEAWPAPSRAFNLCAVQNDGFESCLYMMSGRREGTDGVEFLSDCWEYNPRTEQWRERAALPVPMVAGVGVAFGQNHIFALSGDDGRLFFDTDRLKDEHPGFPKHSFGFHTITNTWTKLGESPANQVTTSAVVIEDSIILPTGEVRPRVRSPKVWRIRVKKLRSNFGFLDYVVLTVYLLSIVAIGVYFARRTADSEAYFRGNGKVPWWAAGCSIFATMLSSLTFTGVPSKAFSQDWVYAIGNFMIPVVAFVAVFVALPFFRRVASVSAYEYLGDRFHWSLRIFGSLMFSVFHLFRMAIVMSLTALALAVATPLTPIQSVLVMGCLSVLYCSLGGVTAVIWTDTLQTFVLLGGALLAILWMLSSLEISSTEAWQAASSQGKLNIANWHWNPQLSQLALWVVVIGAAGQNLSSYTADQAVVQRYMTTETQQLAARSIWTNAILTIPATLLFFGIGTSLFLFYQAYPERLAASTTSDQIFPYFIARELPMGLSGLIVAAIFAAAQSTISTSMNSVATTITNDCIRPFTRRKEDSRFFLNAGRTITIVAGVLGTMLAIRFTNPEIKSLFDEFIIVIGLFMGVLGGLFALGFLFPRANAAAAWLGVLAGVSSMYVVYANKLVQGYLFTTIGILSCVLVGWIASQLLPRPAEVSNA